MIDELGLLERAIISKSVTVPVAMLTVTAPGFISLTLSSQVVESSLIKLYIVPFDDTRSLNSRVDSFIGLLNCSVKQASLMVVGLA